MNRSYSMDSGSYAYYPFGEYRRLNPLISVVQQKISYPNGAYNMKNKKWLVKQKFTSHFT